MSLPKNVKKTLTMATTNSGGDADNRNFEKIKELVEKTANMQLAAEDHQKRTEQYFDQLRQRLNSSSAFLKTAKNDIDNIKFLFQRDHVNKMNSEDYLDNMNKTDEEIEEEIKSVQEKLSNLQNRLQTLKSQTKTESKTFEDAITKTITALNDAEKVSQDENN